MSSGSYVPRHRAPGRHRAPRRSPLPRGIRPQLALPGAAAVALVLSTGGATVAESAPLALEASSTDIALARSQVSDSLDDTSALAERRGSATDQEAVLQGRQQLAERVAREEQRRELERKKAEEAARKKAEAEAKKKAEAEAARQAEAERKARAKAEAEQARQAAAEEATRSGKRYVAPMNRYKYTSGFGSRWGRLHAGADLAAPIGTPLYSVTAGTVIKAAHTGSCGNNVWIEQWDGSVSRYCHMDYMSVRVGQRVAAGEKIGGTGNTGRSYGPHLHLEIRPNGENSNPIDPIGWLRSKGVRL